MIQTARGAANFCTNSTSDCAPIAPSPTAVFTASALRSNTTSVWPPINSLFVMLPPILPRPISPSCMGLLSQKTRGQKAE